MSRLTHLDIESIQWLENFLSTRANAVVLVSHDRAFLNNVTTRTIEITCGQIYDYKVKYDEFVVLRKDVVSSSSVPMRISRSRYRIRKTLSNVSAIRQPRPYRCRVVSNNWKR